MNRKYKKVVPQLSQEQFLRKYGWKMTRDENGAIIKAECVKGPSKVGVFTKGSSYDKGQL